MTIVREKPAGPRTEDAMASKRAPLRPHVVGAVFRRDFLGYFSNPAGYVFITLFVLVSSWVAFCLPTFFANNLANLDTLNQWMPYLLLFFIPAVTMSIWAEERRQGTDELLLTLPARDVEVVLGKYLAALGIYSVALAFSLSHVVVLLFLGRPDLGLLFATYLGYWLMGAMLIAVGMVASIMSSGATVAFILGAVFGAVPVFAGLIGSLLASVPGLGRLLGTETGDQARRLIESLSVPSQFRDFGSGVIPVAGILYFASLAAGMLYLNMLLLGRRHWAGGKRSGGLWAHALVRVAALIVALFSLDVMVAHAGWRVDVTAEGLNTLSKESRRLIADVPKDRPVFITAYYSSDVPRQYVEAKKDLLNLLREVAAVGGDRIRLNLVEADRFSEAARDAEQRFGITPRRVIANEEGRQSSEEIFLGAAFVSGAEQVVVPFFERGMSVEYELVRSIRVASGTKRKKVGILNTDAKLLGGADFRMMGMDQESEWAIVTELKNQYEVTQVSADDAIPDDLDALIVALPSSLTEPQMGHLTGYVRGGGPTLLLLDPLPYFDPSLSPREPRMGPGGPFGQPMPPKGNLAPLLGMLGVDWPDDEIVWNAYNPHPILAEVTPEFLFIGPGAGARDAFGRDSTSSGLQEVLLLFGGHLRETSSGPGLVFTPLLRTDRSGGVLRWDETMQRGLFGPTLQRYRPYLPTGQSYTLAARVRGPLKGTAVPAPLGDSGKEAPPPETAPGAEAHVVLVADLDMISDVFFNLRRRPEELDFLDFDNVTFVLNAVDSLVGDDAFIALRKRRPQHRTLRAVEAQSKAYVEEAQREAKEAEREAKDQLDAAQKRLDEAVAKIQESKEYDQQTKASMVRYRQDVENRKLAVTKAAIEDQKRRQVEQSLINREQAIRGIHNRIKALAILLPPMPALALAMLVLVVRAGSENRGASPNRLV